MLIFVFLCETNMAQGEIPVSLFFGKETKMKEYDITYSEQHTSNGKVSFRVEGFPNAVEAADWARGFEDRHMGYSPLTSLVTNHETGKVAVYCSHWSSCD